MKLNAAAAEIAESSIREADRYRLTVTDVGPARLVACREGGLDVGLMLSRVCLAGLADVAIGADDLGPTVIVRTDQPVLACLASQYAGWQVSHEQYFAMGSGPMRAIAARENIFATIPGRETHSHAVGVLETKKPPTLAVIESMMAKLPDVERLTLLYAPASSLPGTIQVVARSVETALHKLHELQFDVNSIVAGFGVAPLPPVARDEKTAIGRTNDAILYGGRVTLWVNCDDARIDEIGPHVPSSASKDHGRPFAEIFQRYGNFYDIDPLLFSPAMVTFVNLSTGRSVSFGERRPDLLERSFLGGVKS